VLEEPTLGDKEDPVSHSSLDYLSLIFNDNLNRSITLFRSPFKAREGLRPTESPRHLSRSLVDQEPTLYSFRLAVFHSSLLWIF